MIGNGPEWDSPIPAPHIEADRLLGGRSIAPIADDIISDAASVGSEPASVSARLPLPEPELSLRKKPITDLGCLGLLIPPGV